ncbi:hypothetical protein TcBrA4_0040610 [Trypanosoma cruzi]|nr:hypothetical protein TcBrA4_0040610 [Trypanosoma cruzi]
MTASASAVTLRGAPRRHGENVASTVRPQSASESGTVQIASVTPSCTASRPRQSASIAERESVATGTRVGDRDAAARRGTENRLWGHAQWQDTPLGRCMKGCPQLRGEAHRERGESSVQRPASYGPRGSQAASTADRLTPSMACRGCSSQCTGNNSVLSMRGADVVRGNLHVEAEAS